MLDNGILTHDKLASTRSYGYGRVRPGPIYAPKAFGWTGARTAERVEDSGFHFAGVDKRRMKDLTGGARLQWDKRVTRRRKRLTSGSHKSVSHLADSEIAERGDVRLGSGLGQSVALARSSAPTTELSRAR